MDQLQNAKYLLAVVFFVALIFFKLMYLSITYFPEWVPNENILPQYKEDDYKYILLWNTFFEDNAFEFRGWLGDNWESRESFSSLKCPETRCFITNKRKFLSDVTSFDALVFHERNLKPKDLPEARQHSQLYVHYNLEAPFWSLIIGNDLFTNYFNISMSYRNDADLHLRYGELQVYDDKSESVTNSPTQLVAAINDFAVNNTHLAEKLKVSESGALIAQFVSNCETKSEREKLVKSLGEHIKVDVFGTCGNLKCDRSIATDCYQRLNQTYKFYLSLENSVCKDYITEKFFNILPYNVIPIVLNGANMSEVAPPHSYIDVEKFSSTKQLADYLYQVHNNDTLFASYFWWRDFYTIKPKAEQRQASWCKLCELLHSETLQNSSSAFSVNLANILDTKKQCRTPPFLKHE